MGLGGLSMILLMMIKRWRISFIWNTNNCWWWYMDIYGRCISIYIYGIYIYIWCIYIYIYGVSIYIYIYMVYIYIYYGKIYIYIHIYIYIWCIYIYIYSEWLYKPTCLSFGGLSLFQSPGNFGGSFRKSDWSFMRIYENNQWYVYSTT